MTATKAPKGSSDAAKGFGCLVALGVLAAICYGIYTGIDSVGWMSHREDSVITAQANWFVGESKDCMSYPLDDKTAQAMGKTRGYAISKINCDGGPEHNVKVTFFGRTEQPEYSWINWRCTRNEDSFTCKQSGNSPAIMTGSDVKTGRPIISYDGGKTWQWVSQ
jgi:hypothetical protein